MAKARPSTAGQIRDDQLLAAGIGKVWSNVPPWLSVAATLTGAAPSGRISKPITGFD